MFCQVTSGHLAGRLGVDALKQMVKFLWEIGGLELKS